MVLNPGPFDRKVRRSATGGFEPRSPRPKVRRRYVASRWGSTGVGRFGTSGFSFEHPAGGTGVSPLSAGATCMLEAAISEVALSGAIPPAAWCGATVCGS